MRDIRCFVIALAVTFPAPTVTCAAAQAERRPNVVVILADDLGYGDIGCYGHPTTRTPALDRLAREGVRFTCFYSNGPECTPTRTAMMTGRYQHRVGGMECAIGVGNVGRYDDAIRLAEQHDLGLPTSETTIVSLLRKAGYRTACFGKWHLGYEPKFLPLRHGFEQYFSPLGGGIDYFFHTEPDGTPMLYENDRPVKRDGYITDLITDEAVRYLRAVDREQPFFLYVPYTAPHEPLQHPEQRPDRPLTDLNVAGAENYGPILERLDQGIGRVLEALEATRLAEHTLVIFTSDNGATKKGRNAPFSGQKGTVYEGGIRVPAIVRWPGRLPTGAVSTQPAATFDLTRSMARVAGVEAQGRWDGIDILAHVEAGKPNEPRTLFWRQRRGELTWRAVRDGTLKYITRTEGEKSERHLFDLASDAAEREDLIETRTADADRLAELLAAWEAEVHPKR